MTVKKDLKRAVKKALQSKQEKTMPAVLGDYAGKVSTGNPFEVYARLASGQVIKVINQIAPNTWDLKVTIGKANGQRVWQVIGVRDAYADLAAPNVPEHSSQHRYLPIYRDQLIPLLLFPISDTLTAQLMGSVVVCNGKYVSIPSQVIDFSASMPALGARWVSVEYDMSGNVVLIDGDIKDSPLVLTIDDMPLTDSDHYPIAGVRLYQGQSELKYLEDFLYPFIVGEGAGTSKQNLSDLLDVSISTPSHGDLLRYNGSTLKWENYHFSNIKYRQFVYVVSGGDFSFVIDVNGNPVMALESVE